MFTKSDCFHTGKPGDSLLFKRYFINIASSMFYKFSEFVIFYN